MQISIVNNLLKVSVNTPLVFHVIHSLSIILSHCLIIVAYL